MLWNAQKYGTSGVLREAALNKLSGLILKTLNSLTSVVLLDVRSICPERGNFGCLGQIGGRDLVEISVKRRGKHGN